MFKYLFALCGILFCIPVNAQRPQIENNADEIRAFLQYVDTAEARKECGNCDTITLIKEALAEVSSPHKYTAATYRIPKYTRIFFPETVSGEVSFSKSERAMILKWLYAKHSIDWTPALVGNARLINRVEVDSLMHDQNKLLNAFPNGIFEFSQPLFLRNNTICLFYWGHSCFIACGYGHTRVYIKTASGWWPLATIFSWEG